MDVSRPRRTWRELDRSRRPRGRGPLWFYIAVGRRVAAEVERRLDGRRVEEAIRLRSRFLARHEPGPADEGE
ncbi:MAG: hypothetical protein MUE73_13075 [Planctomycetes bacterium]|nr:hypothetical protein [Planctomycetota bacterium]